LTSTLAVTQKKQNKTTKTLRIDAQTASFVTIVIHHLLLTLAFPLFRPLSALGLLIPARQTNPAFLGARFDEIGVAADAISRGDRTGGEPAEPLVPAFRADLGVGIERRRRSVAAAAAAVDDQVAELLLGVVAMTARFGAQTSHVLATFASIILLGKVACPGEVGLRIVILARLLRAVILGRTFALTLMVDVARIFTFRLSVALGIAFVQNVDNLCVLKGQMFLSGVADGKLVVLISREDREVSGVAECEIAVVHDGAEVVRNASGIRFSLDVEVRL